MSSTDLSSIRRVGVIGAGTMGYGIALNFALHGYPVGLYDISNQALQMAQQRVKSALKLFIDEGIYDKKDANKSVNLISFTSNLKEVATNSDFITEAIAEVMEEKRNLFEQLDKLCPSHVILASNSSGLLLVDFAREVKRQDRIITTHYFDPPHIVPGVEVLKGPGTSDQTWNITIELIRAIDKSPIKVLKAQPGFLINQIQHAMRREAYRLWAEGVATAEEIDRGVSATFGFRLPFEGPLMRDDLGGMWRWPESYRLDAPRREIPNPSLFSTEALNKLKARLLDGKTWFIETNNYAQEVEKRDVKLVRFLKMLKHPLQEEQ
jgi:3-hydroxybutyryl-CoA dehydrogenase